MMADVANYRLTVARVDQHCLFELTWGQAQTLKALVPYPDALVLAYQAWQRSYLSFYQGNLLGRAEASGTLDLENIDWHGLLVKSEATLLHAFNQWLRLSELYEIRAALIQGAKSIFGSNATAQKVHPFDVFLTCTPMDLDRLPWEAWEFWETMGSGVRVARTPATIRHGNLQESNLQDGSLRKKSRSPRLLVIIGADDRNTFSHDLQAVQRQFKSIAQVEVIGWQLSAHNIPELKRQIRDAIASPLGWDALLFFGHSNESTLTGGELEIAPHTWISIQELTPQLLKAKEYGLQFALFNSCSGLNIAESLISLGLGQVAIMREPIHNTVAQHFLVHFLQRLAGQEDVHQALISTCLNLAEQQLTYPSASLIPSLFRYPKAPLFQLEPWGWRSWVKGSIPNRREVIFTGVLALLSLLWPIQDVLLDFRMLAQAVYRDMGHEVVGNGQDKGRVEKLPKHYTGPLNPPTLGDFGDQMLLVQIDDDSLRRDRVTQSRPMDRAYLARLIDQLVTLHPRVIGIDYVLDEPQPKTDATLARSMQKASQRGIRFVLAAVPEALNPTTTNALNPFLDPGWSFPGYIEGSHRFMPLMSSSMNGNAEYPFAQRLVIAAQESDSFQKSVSKSSFPSAISSLQPLRQSWLTPINDLSIAPTEVFQAISAWKVLATPSAQWSQLKLPPSPIILIAPGGYSEAGVRVAGEDNLPTPWVTSYWRSRFGLPTQNGFTGGEAHAYRVYQILHQKWVIPLPDVVWIGVAALLGKQVQWVLKKRNATKSRWRGILLGLTGSYGVIGLQLYLSVGILCPWFFPSVIFWYYVLPMGEKKSDG